MTAFAVIKTGGKQYRVAQDDVIIVEKLGLEAGNSVSFQDVLLISDGAGATVGAPTVPGAVVHGEVVDERKGDKIIVFKRKRRQGYRRTKGHRQIETLVRITGIAADGKAAKPAAKKAAPKAEAPAAEAAAPAPAGGDDLKKIGGVGPALEKKLHALGVTSFAQIAAWTPEDVERVDGELNFKGRIDREDWIQQAKDLMSGGDA